MCCVIGHTLLPDVDAKLLFVLSPSGLLLHNLSFLGLAPHAAAVNSQGTAYILCSGLNTTLLTLAADYSVQASAILPVMLTYPGNLAVDTANQLYVTNSYDNAIYVFNPAGTLIRQITAQLYRPRAVAVDSAGRVYAQNQTILSTVYNLATINADGSLNGSLPATFGSTLFGRSMAIDRDGNLVSLASIGGCTYCVFTFDWASGSVLSSWSVGGLNVGPSGLAINRLTNSIVVAGSNEIVSISAVDGSLQYATLGVFKPMSVVVDSHGVLYAASLTGPTVSFNPSTNTTTLFTGDVMGPTSVAVDPSGASPYLYTAGDGSTGVSVWATNGTVLTVWSLSNTTLYNTQLAVNASGYIYVGFYPTNAIWVLDRAGNIVNKQAQVPSLTSIHGMAVSSNGSVFVSDTLNRTVVQLSADLQLQRIFQLPNSFSTGVYGLALDAAGNLYAANKFGSFGVAVFSTQSQSQQLILCGTIAAGFYYPNSLALDQHGALYVADSYNARVVKFNVTATCSPASHSSASRSNHALHTALFVLTPLVVALVWQ